MNTPREKKEDGVIKLRVETKGGSAVKATDFTYMINNMVKALRATDKSLNGKHLVTWYIVGIEFGAEGFEVKLSGGGTNAKYITKEVASK